MKKFWQENGILYIKEEKSVLRPRSIFRYGMEYIRELRVQEIKDSKKAHEIEQTRMNDLYERQRIIEYERQRVVEIEQKRQQDIMYREDLKKQKRRK